MNDLQLLPRILELWDACDVIGDDESTRLYKLTNRDLENLREEDALIRFSIERHGALVRGSSYASLHHWVIDPMNRTRWIEKVTSRRLVPTVSHIDTESAVKSILDEIENGAVRLISENGKVIRKVNIAMLVPDEGARQTIADRRRRLRRALDSELRKIGLSVSERWLIRHVS